MQSVVDALRDIIGTPNFYHQMGASDYYNWDYGAMLEYALAGMVVLIVVGSVFKMIRGFFSR